MQTSYQIAANFGLTQIYQGSMPLDPLLYYMPQGDST